MQLDDASRNTSRTHLRDSEISRLPRESSSPCSSVRPQTQKTSVGVLPAKDARFGDEPFYDPSSCAGVIPEMFRAVLKVADPC